MSQEIEIAGIKISQRDWDETPKSVQGLVRVLSERVIHHEERLSHLEERLNQNSQNSSKPSSKDGFGKQVKTQSLERKKPKAFRKREKPNRELYPPEQCQAVHLQKPSQCQKCGEPLSGIDPNPYRHQVIEMPPIEPHVIEYQLHQLECEHCGALSRGTLPPEVSASGYGENLAAVVSLLSSEYRQSHRMVQRLMAALFNIRISRASVNRLRTEVSQAVSVAVDGARQYVQAQAVLHSDESSFKQGNRDGLNPKQTQGWVWILVTPFVSFFEVALSRSGATAQALIGKDYGGVVVSDRYSSYTWIEQCQRQVCWAHLKRDFTAISQRKGISKDIGQALLFREKRLFRWWHWVLDGTLTREEFRVLVEPLRAGFRAELEEAANLPIGSQEKTPLAKTVRTCAQILKLESALWTFVEIPGVEPTNNAAERGLRPMVIWRRTSFGSQSKAGSQFVSRMLTVATSLKAQKRDVLEFLSQSCRAARLGLPTPSLLPQTQTSQGSF
jgi:transposase